MIVDVLGEGRDLRAERVLVALSAGVAVELDVRQMAAMSLEQFHRLERGRPVARQAEVVAVDVDRVRQAELVDRPGDPADDLTGGHAEAIDDGVQILDVPLAPMLPDLDAARVHQLRCIALRRAEQPGDERLQLLGLVALDRTHHIMIIPHQGEEALVDAAECPRTRAWACRAARGAMAASKAVV